MANEPQDPSHKTQDAAGGAQRGPTHDLQLAVEEGSAVVRKIVDTLHLPSHFRQKNYTDYDPVYYCMDMQAGHAWKLTAYTGTADPRCVALDAREDLRRFNSFWFAGKDLSERGLLTGTRDFQWLGEGSFESHQPRYHRTTALFTVNLEKYMVQNVYPDREMDTLLDTDTASGSEKPAGVDGMPAASEDGASKTGLNHTLGDADQDTPPPGTIPTGI